MAAKTVIFLKIVILMAAEQNCFLKCYKMKAAQRCCFLKYEAKLRQQLNTDDRLIITKRQKNVIKKKCYPDGSCFLKRHKTCGKTVREQSSDSLIKWQQNRVSFSTVNKMAAVFCFFFLFIVNLIAAEQSFFTNVTKVTAVFLTLAEAKGMLLPGKTITPS